MVVMPVIATLTTVESLLVTNEQRKEFWMKTKTEERPSVGKVIFVSFMMIVLFLGGYYDWYGLMETGRECSGRISLLRPDCSVTSGDFRLIIVAMFYGVSIMGLPMAVMLLRDSVLRWILERKELQKYRED